MTTQTGSLSISKFPLIPKAEEMGDKPVVIELKPIDTTANETIKLGEGRHVLGRGPLLACTDKRVSRNHGVIEITADGTIVLESIHVNPCFHRKKGTDKFVTVSKNSKVRLESGDRFSLLPLDCLYEVVDNSVNDAKTPQLSPESVDIEDTNLQPVKNNKDDLNNRTVNGATESSRTLPQWLLDLATAPPAPLPDDETKNKASTPKRAPQKKKTPAKRTNDLSDDEEEKPKTAKRAQKKKIPPKATNEISDDEEEEEETKPPVKKAKAKNPTSANAASTSTKKRPKCLYGAKCYRKNPVHFEEECHPGDDDYVSDEEIDPDDDDSRPECEYGIKCYRKNPQHRKDFKHTKDVRPVRNAAKKAKARTKAMEDSDSDEEEDDDSFIVDDDSDFSAGSNNSDEDVNALVKEAEKFKRNKKLMKPP